MLNTTVDIEKDGPVLSREFDVCEESEIDFGENDDGKRMRQNSNTTIADDSDQFLIINNGELQEAINYRKWSRYSSISQSTDATITSESTRSFEAALELTKPLEMSLLALDNLSMCDNHFDKNEQKHFKCNFRVLQKYAL